MESNGQYHFNFVRSSKKFPKMLGDASNAVTVYTIFCILRKIRKQLCLEAMLEYVDEYLRTIEKSNPVLKQAVSKALSVTSITKIYKDAMS